MSWLKPSTLPRGTVAFGRACLLAAVPREWVVSFPPIDPATQMLTGDIVLASGKQWLRMLLVRKSTPLQVEDQRNAAGLFRQISIGGRTAGHSVVIHNYLNNYPHHQWVLLYKEAGLDITYVIGSPYSGATLTASYNNENNTLNTIQFDHSSLHRPHIYRGTFTLDNNVSVDTGASLGVAYYTATGTEGNSFTPSTNLRGRHIMWISRSGMKDLMPVDGAPTNDIEFSYSSLTNAITVHPDYPLAPSETFFIIYK